MSVVKPIINKPVKATLQTQLLSSTWPYGGQQTVAGSSGPAPWDPNNITTGTVIMWLDPNTGVTKDGGNKVSYWADQSATGIDFEQATYANQFSWDATIFNGSPGLRSEPSLKMTSTTTFSTTGGRYIFAVCKNDSDPSTGVNAPWVFDSVNYGTLLPYLNGTIYDGFGRSTGQTVGNPSQDLAVPFVYTVYTNTSVFTAWIDGTEIFTTGSPAGSLAWPAATCYLGGNGFGSFVGYLGDIIIVDSDTGALSDTDRNYIIDGLKTRAGI